MRHCSFSQANWGNLLPFYLIFFKALQPFSHQTPFPSPSFCKCFLTQTNADFSPKDVEVGVEEAEEEVEASAEEVEAVAEEPEMI